jgi:23S rRNA (uracil1939-C5)-methyltransferase
MTGLPEMLRRLSKPQALGHVELFSGSSLAVLLRHMAPLSESGPDHPQGILRAP